MANKRSDLQKLHKPARGTMLSTNQWVGWASSVLNYRASALQIARYYLQNLSYQYASTYLSVTRNFPTGQTMKPNEKEKKKKIVRPE